MVVFGADDLFFIKTAKRRKNRGETKKMEQLEIEFGGMMLVAGRIKSTEKRTKARQYDDGRSHLHGEYRDQSC